MQSGVSDILSYFVRDYGVHPRHSPRTFPLGLLAPRCLGLALLLAISALRSGGEGRRLFGGRKESPSPSFASSRQGSTNRLSQPPFSFSYLLYVVSLPLRISVLQDNGGAHPLVMDVLAEMSEAQIRMRLTHLPVRAQYPRRGEKR